ncbi:putative transcriptional activator protein IrlR [Leptotrichia wadei]|uniref:Winged helix family two component transcriptional regulator n=2 Tax=Leptotrichia TaxID=32067 RepID=A0A510JQJ3_9FUSO|nr:MULTISPECIES: response regulator transcription factor [Leptotrichia]KXB64078.1 putative transcriptional activator protein IrlR [Leptotrichia wadei]BBM41377.1 winged helix family two component transcriptional regulator [Leptotrichia shahii]BBM49197.1 winged helix family two component transcriptional regulator [Leptotrichia wadei]
MRLLVVEDEKKLNELITKKLEKEYYGVDSCFDGEEAVRYVEGTEYDAIILDIMLPKLDGFEVIKRIRAKKNKVPILLLTARDNIDDKVKGLDYGADDYLVKPFIFEELMARIRVLLRRNSGNADNIITIANLKVDLDAKTVFRDDVLIKLSGREYSILEYLIRNKGKILPRERIEDHIWNYEYEGGTNVIDVYIRYLRKKIDDGYTPKLIHTVRGLGYVLRVDNENK